MQVIQAWVLQIMVVAEGNVRLKIKKTGSRRRIDIHLGRGSSSASRDSSATGQSQKHMFLLHLSPFRAIAPSGELLLGPSRLLVGNDSSSFVLVLDSRCLTAFKPSGELVFRAQSAR